MLTWADQNWMRTIAYLVVGGLCLLAGRREPNGNLSRWRPFWPLTATIFVIMALGRAGGLAEWIIGRFRGEAYEAGWYADRRPLQAAVVIALACAWLLCVLVACWRIPERRRRYLPMTVIVLTVGAYVAVRAVSLHQIDTLLYRRDVSGMRVGTLVEYAVLLIAGLGTLWAPQPASSTPQPIAGGRDAPASA
jgi:hypothetical protein